MTNTTDKPWENEPDHIMFMSDAGYVCEIKRHPSTLHLNGYIYIPFGHPDYGKDYNDLYGRADGADCDSPAAPDVHGGWTYSHQGGDDDGAQFTVFGFDCGHAGDLSPGRLVTLAGMKMLDDEPLYNETYRDIAYVTAQLENAARQFKEREKP